jgi:hypothetical protein
MVELEFESGSEPSTIEVSRVSLPDDGVEDSALDEALALGEEMFCIASN